MKIIPISTYLVIYYDGNHIQAKVIPNTSKDDLVDSLAHIEFAEGHQINATIELHHDQYLDQNVPFMVSMDDGDTDGIKEVAIHDLYAKAIAEKAKEVEGEG